jgi:hypothetical protein
MEEQYTSMISFYDLGLLFALQWIITQINWGLGVNWGLNYTSICCLNRGRKGSLAVSLMQNSKVLAT